MKVIKNDVGFTLIEIIISMALIGVISVALLNTFTFSFSTVYDMGNKTVATKIAQDFMDAHYANAPLSVNGLPTQPTIDSSYTMSRNITVQASGMREVKITVSYKNGTRSIELVALVP